MSRDKKEKTVVVVAACCTREGTVLLARRPQGDRLEKYLEFPGGKVEEGESLEGGLEREILEELKCRIQIKGLIHAQINTYPPDESRYLVLFYQVELMDTPPSHTLWVPYDEIGNYRVLPGVTGVVGRLKRG